MVARAGFTKFQGCWKHSWHIRPYNGVRIAPTPVNQGNYRTCLLCSVAKTAEMIVRKEFADDGEPCDIEISAKALILDYCRWKQILPEEIGTDEETERDRLHDIVIIGQTMGLLASSKTLRRFPVRIRLENIARLPSLSYDQLSSMLKGGKGLLGAIIVGPDFCELGPDEIYSCTPLFDDDGKLMDPYGYHEIVIVACGESETDPVVFLNSHTAETFGRGGFGLIKWTDVLSYCEVSIKYPLTFLTEVELLQSVSNQNQLNNYNRWHPNPVRPEIDGASWRSEHGAAYSNCFSQTKPKSNQNYLNSYHRWHLNSERPEINGASWRSQHGAAKNCISQRESRMDYSRWHSDSSRPEVDGESWKSNHQQQRPPPPRTRTANPAPPPVPTPSAPPPRMQAQEKGPVRVVTPGAVPPPVQPQPASGPGAVTSNGSVKTFLQPAQVPPTPPRIQAQDKCHVPVAPPPVQPQPASGPGALTSNGSVTFLQPAQVPPTPPRIQVQDKCHVPVAPPPVQPQPASGPGALTSNGSVKTFLQPAQVPPTPPRIQAQDKCHVPVALPPVQPQPASGPGALTSNGSLKTQEMLVDQSGPSTRSFALQPTVPEDEETLIQEAIWLTRGRFSSRMAESGGPPSN